MDGNYYCQRHAYHSNALAWDEKGQELKTTRLGKANGLSNVFHYYYNNDFIVRSVNVDISKSYDQGLLEGKKHSTIAFEILSGIQ